MDTNPLRATGEPISIDVAASFTADSLEVPLRFWMEELGQPARIQFAPYGQLVPRLLSYPGSSSNNHGGISVILVRLEDWGGTSDDVTSNSFELAIEENVDEFLRYLRAAAEETPAAVIVCICPSSRDRLSDSDSHPIIAKMEKYLESEANTVPGVHVLHHDLLNRLYPVPDRHDRYTDKLAHIPYTPVYFTALGTMIARKIYALKKLPAKVIVLDCDYTLWEGACAEDGPAGVQMDTTRRSLQTFVLNQYEAGVILCLCSKNNEEDVQAVFKVHPEMDLRWEHFLAARINWKPKSENIKSLANELNLALDSFILIDDDPVECGEVRANCPDVLTIQLPRETERIPKFLDHLWVFDHAKATSEDLRRTELYRENFKRDSVLKQSLTFADFIAELRLEIDISPLASHSLERVSDLTYRTTQFNLSTIRRSESELRNLQREGKEILVVNVQDRFGDYGLVGVIIFQSLSRAMSVDTFLLSCRAMGRGVEHHILAHLGAIAMERDADYVDLAFKPTSRNKPAAAFLESLQNITKISAGEGWQYRIPAKAAANCKLDPAHTAIQAVDVSPATEVTPSIQPDAAFRFVSRSRGDFLIDIAMELNDANTIHETILSQARPDIGVPFEAPRSDIEKEIAGFWSELLGFEAIGINDNFFELGGHSLLAMQIFSRIRTSFNIELSPRLLVIENFTVSMLSRAVLVEQIQRADPAQLKSMLERLDASSIDEVRTIIGEVGDK